MSKKEDIRQGLLKFAETERQKLEDKHDRQWLELKDQHYERLETMRERLTQACDEKKAQCPALAPHIDKKFNERWRFFLWKLDQEVAILSDKQALARTALEVSIRAHCLVRQVPKKYREQGGIER